MNMFVFSLLNECAKNCFCHICVLEHDPTRGFKPTSTNKPASLAFTLLPLPGLICYNAAFYAELTCHSQPHSPTYPDILFWVRSNLRPQWHSVCDVHSGQVPLWSWLAVKTSSPFSCLLPRDITLHPLMLDITTPQRVCWNCSSDGV